MPGFDEFAPAEWITRAGAVRFFGLTDDDAGYDELNELVLEFDIDAELGPIGDVIAINANDPGIKEALFGRHERKVGHRPDDPKKMASVRAVLMNTESAARDQRQAARRDKLPKRIAARKRSNISRMEE